MKGIIVRIYYTLSKYKKAGIFVFGHPIYEDDKGIWRYLKNNKLFDFDNPLVLNVKKKEQQLVTILV